MAIKRPFKMLIYAAPGTGKSVFSAGLPNPFFICTDGNYEWLLDFGAKEDAHINISSYAEFEKLASNDFVGYDTIVVDLLEDIYKWNEYEFCKKNKVDHLSDAGGYGKGWDITRNRLFVACSKLLSLPKNIVFLSHESSYTEKDRKGNEKTKYCPSNLMSEKFLTMLEGRLRYVLRARFEDEVMEDGKVIMHRVLSLVPKSDEYGIIRGVDTNLMPEDIDLDPNLFLEVIGYVGNDAVEEKKPVSVAVTTAVEEPAAPTVEAQPETTAKSATDKQALLAKLRSKVTKNEPAPAAQAAPAAPATPVEAPAEEAKQVVEEPAVPVEEPVMPVEEAEPVVEEKPAVVEKPATKVVVVEEKVEPEPAPAKKVESTEDKIAKIKAKLAAKRKI